MKFKIKRLIPKLPVDTGKEGIFYITNKAFKPEHKALKKNLNITTTSIDDLYKVSHYKHYNYDGNNWSFTSVVAREDLLNWIEKNNIEYEIKNI